MLLMPVSDKTGTVRWKGLFQPIDPATGQPALAPDNSLVVSDLVQDAAVLDALHQGIKTAVSATALTNSAAVATSSNAEEAIIVVPFSATRNFVHIFSRTSGNQIVDLGSANVTVGGGIPIFGGGGFSFIGAGAAGPIYAVTTVASSPLSYVEG